MTEDDPREEMEAMFVQTAESARSAPGTLTLLQISPSTLYFSDRPQRIVGHLTAQHFIDLWDQGENNFAEDPPNAVLASLDDQQEMKDAVVILRNPRLQGNQLTYDVELLDADLPQESGPCTLFIDPLGRPLSPMSVAGVHRRARRRSGRTV